MRIFSERFEKVGCQTFNKYSSVVPVPVIGVLSVEKVLVQKDIFDYLYSFALLETITEIDGVSGVGEIIEVRVLFEVS